MKYPERWISYKFRMTPTGPACKTELYEVRYSRFGRLALTLVSWIENKVKIWADSRAIYTKLRGPADGVIIAKEN